MGCGSGGAWSSCTESEKEEARTTHKHMAERERESRLQAGWLAGWLTELVGVWYYVRRTHESGGMGTG